MSIRPKVFVTRVIPEAGLASIREACDVEIWAERMPPSRQELLRRVPGCAGLISLLSDAIDGEVMDAAGPQLKVISNFAVGYNNIDVAEAARRGIKVGNTPGVLTEATADIAVALLLAASRCLVSSERSIHVGDWQTWEPMGFLGQELTGKTLGIVGTRADRHCDRTPAPRWLGHAGDLRGAKSQRSRGAGASGPAGLVRRVAGTF